MVRTWAEMVEWASIAAVTGALFGLLYVAWCVEKLTGQVLFDEA